MKKFCIALLTLFMLVFAASDVGARSSSLYDSFVKIYGMYYAYPEGLSGGEEISSVAVDEIHSVTVQANSQAEPITSYGYADLAKRSSAESRQALYSQILAACEALCQSNADVEPTVFVTSDGNLSCYVFGEFSLEELGLTISEAIQTWATFKNDHPEYYWFSNQCLYSDVSLYALIYDEYVSADVRAQKDELIESKLSDYVAAAEDKPTLLEKALAVHDLICESAEYAVDDMMATSAHNILGIIEDGKAVCEGYAKLYQLVLNRLGIENIYVTGVAGTSSWENHAWNMVKLDDGQWHTVDTTWDDTSVDGKFVWRYFGMAKNAFAQTHVINTPDSALGDQYFLYDLPESSDVGLGLVALFKNGQSIGVCFNIESAFAKMTDPTAEYEIKLFNDTQIFVMGDKTPEVKKLKITGNYNKITNQSDKIYCVAQRIALLSDIVLENVGITFDPNVNSACTLDINSKKLTLCGDRVVFDVDVEGEYESTLELAVINQKQVSTNEKQIMFNGKVNVPTANVASFVVFNSQANIKTVNIMSNVVEVNKKLLGAFATAERINIPANVEMIFSTAFDSNFSLKEINVDSQNAYYYSVDGILYSKDEGGTLERYPINKPETEFELPQNVRFVGDNAFNGVTALNSIKLKYGCTYIGESAFANSLAIKTVYVPSSVNSVYTGSFAGSSDVVIYCKENSYIHSFAKDYDVDFVLIDEFTYTFYDENGTDIIKQVTDYVGEKVLLPASPQKPSDDEFDYTFESWVGYTNGMTLTADTSFTAKYSGTKRKYTVSFLDANGGLFESFTIEAGNLIPLPDSTPIKAGNAEFSYVFAKWNGYDQEALVYSNMEFAPEFESVVNKYTYTFYHEDGQTVILTQTADYGTIIYPPEAPEKEDLPYEIYIFHGWDGYTEGMALVKDVEFTAIFNSEQIYCTYTFLDDDNTTVIASGSLLYGSSVPLPEDPVKESVDGITYVFIGWSDYNEELQLTEDIIFVAQYRSFTTLCNYSFVDHDGTVISSGALEYGEVIPLPKAPIRPSTQEYSYTFSGWEGYIDGMTAEGNVEFTAKYISNIREYTYVFYDGNNAILKEETAPYGTQIVPPEYSVEGTEQYIHEFSGWTGYTDGMLLTQNREFTPIINIIPIEFTYTFKDEDGTVIKTDKLLVGSVIELPVTYPQKAGHRFVAWDGFTDGMTISEDVEFVAVYELVEVELKSTIYKINQEKGIISSITCGMSISEFISCFDNEFEIIVSDIDGNIITQGTVATGYMVKLVDVDGNELDSAAVSVSGDVNCDGKITVTDFVMVKSHLLNKSELSDDARYFAADMNGDGAISVTDFVLVKQMLLAN